MSRIQELVNDLLACSRHAPTLWLSTDDPAVLTLETDVLFRIVPGGDTAVASMMGYAESEPLMDDYRRITRHARQVVERLFY